MGVVEKTLGGSRLVARPNNRDDEGLCYWRQWADWELCGSKAFGWGRGKRSPHREERGREEGPRKQDRCQSRGEGRRQLVRRTELGGMLPGLPKAGDPDFV